MHPPLLDGEIVTDLIWVGPSSVIQPVTPDRQTKSHDKEEI
jgi:hypothetical protein